MPATSPQPRTLALDDDERTTVAEHLYGSRDVRPTGEREGHEIIATLDATLDVTPDAT